MRSEKERDEALARLKAAGGEHLHPDLIELVKILAELDNDEREITAVLESLGLDGPSVSHVSRARGQFVTEKFVKEWSVSDIVASAIMEGIMVGVRFEQNRRSAS